MVDVTIMANDFMRYLWNDRMGGSVVVVNGWPYDVCLLIKEFLFLIIQIVISHLSNSPPHSRNYHYYTVHTSAHRRGNMATTSLPHPNIALNCV